MAEFTFATFAMPNGPRSGVPGVSVSIHQGKSAHHVHLSMAEAEDIHARLGTSIGTLRLGMALGQGCDPRNVERLYRARLAVQLGLSPADIIAVFDVSQGDIDRMVQEIAR